MFDGLKSMFGRVKKDDVMDIAVSMETVKDEVKNIPTWDGISESEDNPRIYQEVLANERPLREELEDRPHPEPNITTSASICSSVYKDGEQQTSTSICSSVGEPVKAAIDNNIDDTKKVLMVGDDIHSVHDKFYDEIKKTYDKTADDFIREIGVKDNFQELSPMIVKDEAKLTIPCEKTSVEECDRIGIWDTMRKVLDENPNGLAVAANQIGILKRAILVRIKNGEKVLEIKLVNPEIIESIELRKYEKEGCLSFPGKFINTWRYWKIRVKDDIAIGDREYVGILSVVLQHEIDHINGILMFSHQTETFKRIDVKIGRNDPCPCKSGKKYKKCCLK